MACPHVRAFTALPLNAGKAFSELSAFFFASAFVLLSAFTGCSVFGSGAIPPGPKAAGTQAQTTVEQPQTPLTGTSSGSEAPVSVKVAQAFFVEDELHIKVHVRAKTDLPTGEVVVQLSGLREGQKVEEQTRRLSEVMASDTIEAEQVAALPFVLRASELSEYQVRCSWGEDAIKLINERRAAAGTESKSEAQAGRESDPQAEREFDPQAKREFDQRVAANMDEASPEPEREKERSSERETSLPEPRPITEERPEELPAISGERTPDEEGRGQLRASESVRMLDVLKEQEREIAPDAPSLAASLAGKSREVRDKTSQGASVTLREVAVEQEAVPCDVAPCDIRYTISGRLANEGTTAVAEIRLGLGLYWANEGQLPAVPSRGSPITRNEELVDLRELVLASGESKPLLVHVDRNVPVVPGGGFIPHLRIISYAVTVSQELAGDGEITGAPDGEEPGDDGPSLAEE